MVTTEKRDETPARARASLRGPLLRYRVMAYTTGVALLGLTTAFILKYAAGSPGMMSWMGVTHGVLYMVYLAVAVDLALRARWSIRGTLLVLVAGMVPFLSFVTERVVSQRAAEGREF
jgi:integral membrane protein